MTVAQNKQAREHLVHVIQGEYLVTTDPSSVLTTILGSCVATCIWDPVACVGGMNHFLLPGEDVDGDDVKYGVNAMELLINGLLQNGGLRGRLQAKLFGGAHVLHNMSDVGAKNAEFAQRFLGAENIVCVAKSLGGDRARRIRFWPTTGRAGQMLLDSGHSEVQAAERRAPKPQPNPAAGSVELF
jgi:chemotaxis protein CheD